MITIIIFKKVTDITISKLWQFIYYLCEQMLFIKFHMKLMYEAIFEKDNLENVANNRKFSFSLIIIFLRKIRKKQRKEERKERKRQHSSVRGNKCTA